MTEKRFMTNYVGCIVDLEDKNLTNYDGQEIVDLLNQLANENKQLKQANTEFKKVVTCKHCKYASHFPAQYWYPSLDPQCAITKLSITPDQPACNHFKLLGRLSR